MRNQDGFGLIQVVIAAGLMSVVALGVGTLIEAQKREVGRLEDKLARLDLEKQLATMMDNRTSCDATMQGVSVNAKKIPHIQDAIGNQSFTSNQKFGHLSVSRLDLSNVDVPATPNGQGRMKITATLSNPRDRFNAFTHPIEVTFPVTLDGSMNVASCSLDGSSSDEMGCLSGDSDFPDALRCSDSAGTRIYIWSGKMGSSYTYSAIGDLGADNLYFNHSNGDFQTRFVKNATPIGGSSCGQSIKNLVANGQSVSMCP